MFTIEFYRTNTGFSDIEIFLETLLSRIETDKDARIQYRQIVRFIQLLEDHGTRLGEEITKHLEGDIWELRPGCNRVLFFYFERNTFVLLHHFRKTTQKTPRREIERAISEMRDWKTRKAKNYE
ncbi:MAG: type II toxin-antitoxin system RelE/ParE family toxin [Lachnospiraceae bacterium]|nr:type II toxin-antitoxin system RelE/ParE family toxin [Lachnospiraceae bacterium]